VSPKQLGEGISSLSVAPWGDIVVGSGCGTVAVLNSAFKILTQTTLVGRVTSLSMVSNTNSEIICGTSDLFFTSPVGGFHAWNSHTYKELLRVDIPRSECNCSAIPADGTIIVTGWSDGRIKGFSPQVGKELWVINEAHLNGVTTITIFNNICVTGGKTGDICIWNITKKLLKFDFQKMGVNL
jgi:WD40 repeat protein